MRVKRKMKKKKYSTNENDSQTWEQRKEHWLPIIAGTRERAVTQSKHPAEGQTVAYPCEASVTEQPVSPLSVKPPRDNSGGGVGWGARRGSVHSSRRLHAARAN